MIYTILNYRIFIWVFKRL